jgi:nicotinamidase-related amidase
MLEPTDTQIVLADLQTGVMPLSTTNPPSRIAYAAGGLVELAELMGIPLTIATVPGHFGAELVDELAAAATRHPTFERTTPDIWNDAPTRQAILDHKRSTLVLAGVVTEVVVEQTALSALAEGFEVLVPVDACGGCSARAEQVALDRLQAAGATLTTAVGVLTRLVPDLSSPTGQLVLPLFGRVLRPNSAAMAA